MASILNTDLFDLYDQLGQRVAFNEGYQRQRITEARQAGADAFHLGLDKKEARSQYLQQMQLRRDEASNFIASGGEVAPVDDTAAIESVETEPVETEDIGEVLNGEETLGIESVVADETEYRVYSQEEIDSFAPDEDQEPIPHLDEFHDYLHATRDQGESFVGFHEWHMDNYGDFGIR